MSSDEQRGLFGEMDFLRLLLHKGKNHYEIINSWRGASGANQDFSRNLNAVEIKTTISNNPSVQIANEKQLDFTVLNNLFLGLIVVSESSGHVHSLYSIIKEIKGLLNYDPILLQEFENKLNSIGINDEIIELYNETSYSVNNRKFFHIKEGFPVIIRKSLPNDAIFKVSYQLDLSSCNSFEIPEEEVIKKII